MFELQQALALGKINFSLKTVQCIIRLYDADGSGKISLTVRFCWLAGRLVSRGWAGVERSRLWQHALQRFPPTTPTPNAGV